MSVGWKRALAAIAAAVALLASFLVGRATTPAEPDGPPPAAPPVVALAAGRYVALGDSYSAGEGLPGYEPGTEDVPAGDRCHRSPGFAYPLKLTFVNETEVLHRACSGAVVVNVFEEVQRHGGVPSHQGLQAAPGIITDEVVLVTITMGGNDVGFADMLIFCAKHRRCMDDRFEDGMTLAEFADARLDTLRGDLTAMYGQLRSVTPEPARILVIGYPALFPESVPSLFAHPFCRSVFAAFGDAERTAIRDWNVRLNEEVRGAAREAGVEYVDIYAFFAHHEVCGAAGGWLKFVGKPSREERDGWFHPTVVGQAMIARIVACYLHVYRSPLLERGDDLASVLELTSCVADTYPTAPPGGEIAVPTPAAT